MFKSVLMTTRTSNDKKTLSLTIFWQCNCDLRASDQMEKTAVLESRIISKKEMGVRKTIGIICMSIIALILIVFPSSRDYYVPMSVALAMAIGIWRTGNQSLWGCVVNGKWNIDGKGYKTPSSEYMDFIKTKQNEFHRLQMTTFVAVIIGTVTLAAIRGDATQELVLWILVNNIIGVVFGYVLSLAAN